METHFGFGSPNGSPVGDSLRGRNMYPPFSSIAILTSMSGPNEILGVVSPVSQSLLIVVLDTNLNGVNVHL
jgi:hypothetical protein